MFLLSAAGLFVISHLLFDFCERTEKYGLAEKISITFPLYLYLFMLLYGVFPYCYVISGFVVSYFYLV